MSGRLVGGRGTSARERLAAVLAVGALATACVGPARSYGAFEGKAGGTAASMRSAVESARAAAALAEGSKAFGPYLTVMLEDAEHEAGSTQAAFDSIQPPDGRSDRLRRELDALLSSALSTIRDLRIAARRGDLEALPELARPLARVSEQLDRFTQAHPSGGS